MGLLLLLDKSSVESIGTEALRVQSDIFFTVVAPVLVWEICGDIQKVVEGDKHKESLLAVALRAKPLNSIVPIDWRKICLLELTGHQVQLPEPGKRQAVVDGAHKVPRTDGNHAVLWDVQPEADALLRWARGEWTQTDSRYAEAWRKKTRSLDLNLFRKRFGPARNPPQSIDQLQGLVSLTVRDPSLQLFFLELLLDELVVSKEQRHFIRQYWLRYDIRLWHQMCPFAFRSMRCFLVFYLALAGNLIGTKATNRVDLEYFFYTPFVNVFASGDKVHKTLAPLLLDKDQRFVEGPALRNALQEEADRRNQIDKDARLQTPDVLEPPEGSMLRQLWIDIHGRFRDPPSKRQSFSGTGLTEPGAISKKFNEMMKHVEANPEKYQKRPPWPAL